MSEKKTTQCKNCIYWNEEHWDTEYRRCESPKTFYEHDGDFVDDGRKNWPSDGLMVSDFDGSDSDALTGPEYGCVNGDEG